MTTPETHTELSSKASSGILAPPNADLEANPEKRSESPLAAHNPRAHIPTWEWVLSLIGLYLGALLYGLDTTIAADVQASVYESLGDIENLAWIGLGFPMASVAVILPVGRAYGLYNVKWMMWASVIVFEGGSALCGGAPTSDGLIIGRVIAGIGGAGMYLGALNYISFFTTAREAALYNALIGLSWGVGAILGPVVGGAFSVSSATWRWAFYINLPLAGIIAPIYIWVLPRYDPQPQMSYKHKWVEIDWLGSVLFGAIIVLFMIVVTFGGSTYAWNSSASIALWVVWGVCLVTFILQQWRPFFTTRSRQIYPVHFLKSRTMVLLYVATAAAAAANGITLYYIPLFFQFTRGDSALKAAVRLLPFICVFIFFVMLAGGSLPVVGRYNIFYMFGGALVLTGGALLFTIDVDTSVGKIYGYEALVAAGSGFVFQNAYSIAAAKVSSAEDKSKAIGFINVAQIGSIAIALSIAGALFQNLGFQALKSAFEGFGFPDEYVRSALAGSISPIFSGPQANAATAQLAVRAVADTVSRLFGTLIAAGAVLVVAAGLMKWERLQLDITAGG